MELLFLIGRILYGGFFVMNGIRHIMNNDMLAGYASSKGIANAKFMVHFSGLFILLGGLGIALGVYIQYAVLLLAVFLLAVSFKMHAYWAVSDPMAKMGDQVNFMKNMALLGAALMMLMIPEPWAYAAW
ncbi:MAG: DoxX family membrane protein [Candidatus Liptonbacteria bacterium]|nr:DoxX family membrane protein [Candidatus Liptonbacteria bacterium]